MAKCLVSFISLLIVPVFIAGCHTTESESAEHIRSEPLKLESKSYNIESDDIISDGSISSQPGPIEIESIEFEHDTVESIIVELNEPVRGSVRTGRPVENSAASFHDKCAEILTGFVDEKGMVDYKRLRRQRLKLKALQGEFDALEPDEYTKWTKEEKIAFWLNVHNIQILKIITDNYPIQSSRILRLYPGWGPNSILHIKGIWTKYKFLVMDEEFTLSEIDKCFFRKEFDDPRIFFAVSRGSLSSPPLNNKPYYGYSLNQQLDDQVKRFLSSPLALRIDSEKQHVYLSALFQSSSYGKEFLEKFAINKKFKDHDSVTRAVLNFITNYVSKDIVSFLETGNYSVKYMKYNWTINDGS